MEGELTLRTDKKQALVRPVLAGSVAAAGAHLAGVVGIHLHAQRASERRFVGQEALQFGKSPVAGVPIGSAVLLAGLFALLAFRALANTRQIFHSDEGLVVGVNNVLTDHMIGI